jgi:hypothetical protein
LVYAAPVLPWALQVFQQDSTITPVGQVRTTRSVSAKGEIYHAMTGRNIGIITLKGWSVDRFSSRSCSGEPNDMEDSGN